MATGFDINNSRVAADTMADWIASEVSEDILTVPNIGPGYKIKLAEAVEGDAPICTTHQLIGKFLTLREEGMTPKEHVNAMWYYLKLRGVDAGRSGIVHALGAKVNEMIPGTFTIDDVQ